LEHPSRKLVSERLEVLAEVYLIVHPRMDSSNGREPTPAVGFLGDLLKELFGEAEVISRPSLLFL
jgi:hypothetical protein